MKNDRKTRESERDREGESEKRRKNKLIRMYLGLCVKKHNETNPSQAKARQEMRIYEQKFTAIFKCSKINAVNIMDT